MNYSLLFFNISTGEIFIIILVFIVIFGPSKIPEIAKKLGRALYEVKRASNDIKREIDIEVRKIEQKENKPKTKETEKISDVVDSKGNIPSQEDVKTDISSFSIKIEREEIPRIFSKNDYKYIIRIDGSARGYSSFNRMSFNSELLSDRCKKVITNIFNYLLDIDEQRKIEQTNNTIQNIIIILIIIIL